MAQRNFEAKSCLPEDYYTVGANTADNAIVRHATPMRAIRIGDNRAARVVGDIDDITGLRSARQARYRIRGKLQRARSCGDSQWRQLTMLRALSASDADGEVLWLL